MRRFRDQQPNIGIEPLNVGDRESYPSIIYQLEATSVEGVNALVTAVDISTDIGLPFVVDTNVNDEGINQAIVRSSSDDRFEVRTHSALFHGTTALLGEHMPDQIDEDVVGATLVRSLAETALGQIVGSEELKDGFGNFYSGLRWSTDQEKFVSTLFCEATEIDFNQLDAMMTSGNHVPHPVS